MTSLEKDEKDLGPRITAADVRRVTKACEMLGGGPPGSLLLASMILLLLFGWLGFVVPYTIWLDRWIRLIAGDDVEIRFRDGPRFGAALRLALRRARDGRLDYSIMLPERWKHYLIGGFWLTLAYLFGGMMIVAILVLPAATSEMTIPGTIMVALILIFFAPLFFAKSALRHVNAVLLRGSRYGVGEGVTSQWSGGGGAGEALVSYRRGLLMCLFAAMLFCVPLALNLRLFSVLLLAAEMGSAPVLSWLIGIACLLLTFVAVVVVFRVSGQFYAGVTLAYLRRFNERPVDRLTGWHGPVRETKAVVRK